MINVELATCEGERTVRLQTVCVDDGATVADVLRAAGVGDGTMQRHATPAMDAQTDAVVNEPPVDVGVWGRRLPLDWPVHEGDRVERYQPLMVTPMQARHRRQASIHKQKSPSKPP